MVTSVSFNDAASTFAPQAQRGTAATSRRVDASITPWISAPFSARVDSQRTRRLAGDLEQRGFALHHRVARADLPAIDHLVVAPTGVWVIAREHVHCARVTVRGRLSGRTSLRIGSRDRTALVDALDHQVTAVRAALYDFPDAPVQAALCLPGAEFPLLRTLTVRDHLILRPAQLLDHLEGRGPLRRARSREVAKALDARLG